jgi:hypothetical protein
VTAIFCTYLYQRTFLPQREGLDKREACFLPAGSINIISRQMDVPEWTIVWKAKNEGRCVYQYVCIFSVLKSLCLQKHWFLLSDTTVCICMLFVPDDGHMRKEKAAPSFSPTYSFILLFSAIGIAAVGINLPFFLLHTMC